MPRLPRPRAPRPSAARAASLAVLLSACGAPAPTGPAAGAASAPAAARAAANFPDVIPLPNGFAPEGIATGRGTSFYVGSLANGAVYRGDLRTGAGAVLVPGAAGRVAVGLEYDQRGDRLWVAGGVTGAARVYDAATGALLASYQLAPAGSGAFINDAVVTRDAVYFTNSTAAVLYRVPLGRGGALPGAGAVETLPLGGTFTLANGFNANGIEASPDGRTLLVVNSTTGLLYRVDAATGVAATVDLGGATLTAGDGILLVGRTLYVVRNRLNRIAEVRLGPDYATGEVTRELTDPDFRVPTTVAAFGGSLYAVNARFGVTPGPDVAYEVVRVDR